MRYISFGLVRVRSSGRMRSKDFIETIIINLSINGHQNQLILINLIILFVKTIMRKDHESMIDYFNFIKDSFILL